MVLLHLICLLFCVANIHAHNNPNTLPFRNGIVNLFEWRFSDIALECENFLGPRKFAGVQVSPVQEHLVLPNRPWWERYQPVSYRIYSRSGDEAAFRDMVSRCNKVGVRIYVDVVLNHMTEDRGNIVGYGGCTANTSTKSYPCVPYGPGDFNPTCEVTNYNDPINVRNCRLEGKHDLNQGSDWVRARILDFLNLLIDIGVAGFRIEAAKHMWPGDLKIIFCQLKYLNPWHGFPLGAKPFIYLQVIDYGNGAVTAVEYTDLGRVTEYKYGNELGNAFRGNNLIRYLKNFGEEWGFLRRCVAIVFVDDYLTQRISSPPVLTYRDARLYKMAIAFMLAWPYGYPLLLSGYQFNDPNQGPPTLPPTFNPDDTCNNGWVCEHRWRQIYNMVKFSIVVAGTDVTNWWDNGQQLIAFGRGNKGFIAFNGQYNTNMNVNLQTGLPAGTYCDVISGSLLNGVCTGRSVYVGANGVANIVINSNYEDGVLAIHVKARL